MPKPNVYLMLDTLKSNMYFDNNIKLVNNIFDLSDNDIDFFQKINYQTVNNCFTNINDKIQVFNYNYGIAIKKRSILSEYSYNPIILYCIFVVDDNEHNVEFCISNIFGQDKCQYCAIVAPKSFNTTKYWIAVKSVENLNNILNKICLEYQKILTHKLLSTNDISKHSVNYTRDYHSENFVLLKTKFEFVEYNPLMRCLIYDGKIHTEEYSYFLPETSLKKNQQYDFQIGSYNASLLLSKVDYAWVRFNVIVNDIDSKNTIETAQELALDLQRHVSEVFQSFLVTKQLNN